MTLPAIPDRLCTLFRPDWREFLVLADQAEERMQDEEAAYLRRIANGVHTHVRCGCVRSDHGGGMWLMWPGFVETISRGFSPYLVYAGVRWVREDIITHPLNPYKILNPEMVRERLINVWDGTGARRSKGLVRGYLLALGEQT